MSVELVVASGLLGGMCGLYFMGFALRDATYRAEFDTGVMADIQWILAVRVVDLGTMTAAGGPPLSR